MPISYPFAMSSNPALHIVAFDIPYPPNYGGVIDVFYRLRALSEQNVRIHLHCFRYRGKPPAPPLEKFCEAVHYYPRPLGLRYQFSPLPFIVASRRPPALLKRLVRLPYPILLEGLHTCGFIDHQALQGRRQAVRMHNIEWRYYQNLARLESRRTKRLYLHLESRKLKHFEARVLPHANLILPISDREARYFRMHHPNVQLLPAFHGNRKVCSLPGRGSYALFHGNLSVRDNERAARFFMEEVFAGLSFPLVIAGLAPSDRLRKDCRRYPNVRLVDSPSDGALRQLMREAHLHLLYSQQADGVKIKLLNALHQGRFCLASTAVVEDSGLKDLCLIADTSASFQKHIANLLPRPFPEAEIIRRKKVLSRRYSDRKNATLILRSLS